MSAQQQQSDGPGVREETDGSAPCGPPAIEDIDLGSVKDIMDLAAMSSERLSHELRKRGMSGGGSAVMKAEKLWWRCKMRHFADVSRHRIKTMTSKRPNGAYGTVQPLNLVSERERFLLEAAEYEGGTRRQLPSDPQFIYADSDCCTDMCPLMSCTCARGRMWADYGDADASMLPQALAILQRASDAGVLPGPAAVVIVAAATSADVIPGHGNASLSHHDQNQTGLVLGVGIRIQTCREGGGGGDTGDDTFDNASSTTLMATKEADAASTCASTAAASRERIIEAHIRSSSSSSSSNTEGGEEERSSHKEERCGEPGGETMAEVHATSCKKSEATVGVAAVETAGPSVDDMTEEEAEREVAAYLKMHGISEVVRLEWLEKDMCQVPSMRTSTNAMATQPVTGKLHLVRGAPIRRQRLKGLLDHEIGTHFLRAYNELTRRKLPLAHTLPGADGGVRREVSTFEDLETEEGLATLNTHFSSTHKLLWSPALSYLVQARSRDLGFTQVFLELKQFIPSAASRWAFCMRSKRGMRDTSKPGCMAKDRAYLQGALKILTRRRELDFTVLHSGKIAVSEHAGARKHLRALGSFRPRAAGDKRQKLVTPHFIRDMGAYMRELDAIAAANGVCGDGFLTAGAPSNGPMLHRSASNIMPTSGGELGVAKLCASARRRSVSSLGCSSMSANAHKVSLAKPLGAVAAMAAKLEEENAKSRARSRSKTEKRLHALDSKREESRRETLEKCFSKRSRWGGLAFSWD